MGRGISIRFLLIALACALGSGACDFSRTTQGLGFGALLQSSPNPGAPHDLAVTSFNASALSISPGGSSVLSWAVANATAVTIDHGIGGVSVLGGSIAVSPNVTTTYTLSATGLQSGIPVTISRSVSVVVLESSLQAESLIFVTQPTEGEQDMPLPAFSVGALDQNGAATNFPADSTCNVSVATNSSGGMIGGTYQGIPASGGQAVFTQVSLGLAGTYSLTATCTGVANPTPVSAAFVVTGSSVQSISLTYSSIPLYGWMSSGEALTFILSLTDAEGNPVQSGTVTASLPAGSQGTLGGPTSATILSGSANFAGISISTTVSQEFTLTFQSGTASTQVTVPISVTAGPTVPSLPAVQSVNQIFTDGTSLYISTDQGIAKSTDGGNTFSIVVSATTAGGSMGGAVSNGIYYSITYPQTNTYQTGQYSEENLAVVNGGAVSTQVFSCGGPGVGPSGVWDVVTVGGKPFVGTDCGLYSSADGGKTFPEVTLPVNAQITQLAVSSKGVLYVFEYYQGVAVSTDGGNNFSALSLERLPSPNLTGMWLVNDVLYVQSTLDDASGNFLGSYVSRSADGGQTFTPVSFSGHTDLDTVAMTAANGVIYVESLTQADSPLWASSDGGNSFAVVNAVGGNYVFDGESLFGFNGSLFASYPMRTGYPGLLCRSSDGGKTFQCSF